MVRTCLLLMVLVGCGSSAPAPDDALDEEDRRERSALQRATEEGDRLRAEEPEAPYETMGRRAFQVDGTRCGQGPYRASFDALGTRHGERIYVYACAPREISGRYRLQRSGRTEQAESRSFGYSQDNARCVASEVERTSGRGTSGARNEGGVDDEAARAGDGGHDRDAAEPVELTEIGALEACPEGLHRIGLVHGDSWRATGGAPGLSAETSFELEIWSALPNDLEDVLFVIEQQGIRTDVTVEQWQEYTEAHDRWYERYRAFLDGEVEAGRARIVEDEGGPGPPPALREEEPPPRPSTHADWVPGYWHFEGRWSWIPGLWRVPESDVRAQLTVQAPRPPPAPRTEAPSVTKPVRNAVWAGGHWQWNGRAYVWVPGAWRLPPTAQHAWQPAGWRPGAGGSVFIPGGWTLSVGGH